MQSNRDETLLSELYLAGHRTPPGRYRELNTGRIVQLEYEDTLPASLDGRVACYVRLSGIAAQLSTLSQAVE